MCRGECCDENRVFWDEMIAEARDLASRMWPESPFGADVVRSVVYPARDLMLRMAAALEEEQAR